MQASSTSWDMCFKRILFLQGCVAELYPPRTHTTTTGTGGLARRHTENSGHREAWFVWCRDLVSGGCVYVSFFQLDNLGTPSTPDFNTISPSDPCMACTSAYRM